MTLNKLIQNMMDTFPTLFQHREEALDHLYLTIGNGYDWGTDGTIPRYGDYPKRTLREAVEEGQRDFYKGSSNMIKFDQKKGESFEQMIQRQTDRRVKEIESRPKRATFYPMSRGYSMVTTIPDNVQQDYLDGAFEILQAVIDSPDAPYKPRFWKEAVDGNEALRKIQEKSRKKQRENAKLQNKGHLKTKKLARELIKELEARFPGRKATGGRATIPGRVEPSMYHSSQDLLKFNLDDKVRVKFGKGYKVPKRFEGRTLTFTVDNCEQYKYRIESKVLVLKSVSNPKDIVVVHPTDRFECLMIDLFPVNRRPYAGWKNKNLKLKKV